MNDSPENPRAYDAFTLMHGGFGAVAGAVCKTARLPVHISVLITLALAIAWELLERVPCMTRAVATLWNYNYVGDSVLNSFFDVLIAVILSYVAYIRGMPNWAAYAFGATLVLCGVVVFCAPRRTTTYVDAHF
jgi:hypothetical protein